MQKAVAAGSAILWNDARDYSQLILLLNRDAVLGRIALRTCICACA